jgi:hypothetical protein
MISDYNPGAKARRLLPPYLPARRPREGAGVEKHHRGVDATARDHPRSDLVDRARLLLRGELEAALREKAQTKTVLAEKRYRSDRSRSQPRDALDRFFDHLRSVVAAAEDKQVPASAAQIELSLAKEPAIAGIEKPVAIDAVTRDRGSSYQNAAHSPF